MGKREMVLHDGHVSEFVTQKSSVHVLRPHFPNRVADPVSFSICRGVLIVWDEDYDSRIIDFVNSLSEDALAYIHCVGETKGSLSIGLCTGSIVKEVSAMCRIESEGIEVCGDWWVVYWYNSTTGKELQYSDMA